MSELLKSKEEFLWDEWYGCAITFGEPQAEQWANKRLREYRAAVAKWKTYRSTLEC